MTEEVKEPDLDGSDNSIMSENSDVETKSQAVWSDSFSEDEAKMVKDTVCQEGFLNTFYLYFNQYILTLMVFPKSNLD